MSEMEQPFEDSFVESDEDDGDSMERRLEAMAQRYVSAYGERFVISVDQVSYLIQIIAAYLVTRNRRSDDMLSSEVSTALSIENELYPWGAPRFSLCADGRTQTKLVASSHGGSIRTPAGDHADFLPDWSGGSFFLTEGQMAHDVLRWMARSGRIAWVFDSHLGCAKRKEMAEDMHGVAGPDDGRKEDVVRKREISKALLRFAESIGQPGTIMPIQVSYDPHNGFLYMGLERETVMTDPRVVKDGFTEYLLDELATEGAILSTRLWTLPCSFLYAIFSAHVFPIDYEADYRHSALEFWSNMRGFANQALPPIVAEVKRVFGDIPDDETSQRAVLLLANAYTGFLLNMREGGNPYTVHDEEMIAVTMGDRGPYMKVHAFCVNPHSPNTAATLKFVEALIRENRRSGRVMSISGDLVRECFGGISRDFIQCAVPVALFEVLDGDVEPDSLDILTRVDWSELVRTDWMAFGRNEFALYCRRKMPGVSMSFFLSVFEHLEHLRQTARSLFSPGLPITDDLLSGRLIPLWILRDHDRRMVTMLPFLAVGYSPDSL